MSIKKSRVSALSTEIIKELEKLAPVRLSTPRDCGYGDAINDAILLVRSVRVKRGLKAKKTFVFKL
jgi:hypothetical protein